jgi:hypothetical protein
MRVSFKIIGNVKFLLTIKTNIIKIDNKSPKSFQTKKYRIRSNLETSFEAINKIKIKTNAVDVVDVCSCCPCDIIILHTN